ncbi:protein turtle homolog A [Procambarus clarkii]|uniref:protein turtle homolog A n=1 Tax=Procambarus clarkii TaxID=6728 RepID=UPI0037436813
MINEKRLTVPVVAVTGVWGGSAALPCEVSHPPVDSVYLLLWFRDHLTTPIYRLDERWLGRGKERHWSDEEQLGSRAVLEVTTSPALLRVSNLGLADQGLYTCRVDFKVQPTKTTRVNLTVVVPPESVSVIAGVVGDPQLTVTSVAGPYQEGDMLVLTCIAHGGVPRPSVVWFEDTHLLDSHMESHEVFQPVTQPPTAITVTPVYKGSTPVTLLQRSPATVTTSPSIPPAVEPYNTLTLGPLTRNDLKLLLTCEASNNNLTLPTSLVVMVDMNLPALSVVIRAPELPLRAGREYQLVCEVRGSRPPPTITWYDTHTRIPDAIETTSADGNVTTSTLVFTPRPEDHGTTLRCLAETRAAHATMDDVWNLTVHYLPTAAASFGSSLDEANIKEGDDVYFECFIEANPRVSHVSWRHNNEVLVHNLSSGVIISNQSLVLQRVVRSQAGRYSCHAHNVVGDGSSNFLRLDVKYAPVCSPGQVTTYAVGRNEDAEVTCSVQANPLQATFQWTFNNTADTIDVPQGRFTSSSSHSVITYTPMTSLDYGTLLCWASNEIGTQKEPCVFHIVPAGKPDPPGNCTVGARTRSSVRVKCVAGHSGGLPQRFLLQSKLQEGQHLVNLSAPSPVFFVEGLQAGKKYDLVITAYNEKGSSLATHVTVSSSGANGSVFQPHDGPSEAEVRDGGKNGSGTGGSGGSGGSSGSGSGIGSGNKKYLSVLALPSLMPAALGVGAGLILIIIVLIFLITFRTRLPHHHHHHRHHHHPHHHHHQHHPDTPTHDTEPEDSPKHPNSPSNPIHHPSCLERETQVESESDAEPDVIPLQEGCRPGDQELNPAILLPPDRYKYAPVSPHVPLQAVGRYDGVATTVPATSFKPTDVSGYTLPYDTQNSECPHSQHLQLPTSATLPRSAHRPPGQNCRHSPPINPHQLPFPGIEGSLPPPPVEYQNSRRKRGSLGESACTHSAGEEDTPSTPLLAKRESSV